MTLGKAYRRQDDERMDRLEERLGRLESRINLLFGALGVLVVLGNTALAIFVAGVIR